MTGILPSIAPQTAVIDQIKSGTGGSMAQQELDLSDIEDLSSDEGTASEVHLSDVFKVVLTKGIPLAVVL
ncbi:hypothetical protein [Paracoccus pantotrophus]|uniref:hypothetical protein n=1 Tax=Paracoccus pantotrophus TaxID=82367 RepID=UPI000F6B1A30|nr:hypothetical protein [Paracoccus pantotrophus]RNI13884.1 hypothetical protein EB844_20865 [Paracoccus pantotrophus]